jgi:hypothetical protein
MCLVEMVTKLRDSFRALGQGDRKTPQPSGSGRRARIPRVQEWHKCTLLVECKRDSSDGITAACFTRTRAEPDNVPAGSGVPQAGVVLLWLGTPPRDTEVSIVMRISIECSLLASRIVSFSVS